MPFCPVRSGTAPLNSGSSVIDLSVIGRSVTDVPAPAQPVTARAMARYAVQRPPGMVGPAATSSSTSVPAGSSRPSHSLAHCAPGAWAADALCESLPHPAAATATSATAVVTVAPRTTAALRATALRTTRPSATLDLAGAFADPVRGRSGRAGRAGRVAVVALRGVARPRRRGGLALRMQPVRPLRRLELVARQLEVLLVPPHAPVQPPEPPPHAHRLDRLAVVARGERDDDPDERQRRQ